MLKAHWKRWDNMYEQKRNFMRGENFKKEANENTRNKDASF